MSRINDIISALEAERAEAVKHVQWLESQLDEFRAHASATTTLGDAPAARSRRRQTAKRASTRRATARTLKRDVAADITAYIAKHPGSTAGDVAKGLGLNRDSVATRLSVMVKSGALVKAQRGYTAPS